MGSVSDLIASIGGGRALEAGGKKPSTAMGDAKNRRWKRGNKKRGRKKVAGSKEMQEMLQGRFRGKPVTMKTRPTTRSGPM